MASKKKPAAAPKRVEGITFYPGDASRLQCSYCRSEFDLTYEPKMTGTPALRGVVPKAVQCCPFCKSTDTISETWM